MLQGWPKATSCDYTDTRVTGNRIDCGAERRCGFGIMIGSTPWYDAPAFGGSVTGNVVRGALLALNVDKLTRSMVIERNNLNSSSGTYPTMCGPRSLQGVSFASLPFPISVKGRIFGPLLHLGFQNWAVEVPGAFCGVGRAGMSGCKFVIFSAWQPKCVLPRAGLFWR